MPDPPIITGDVAIGTAGSNLDRLGAEHRRGTAESRRGRIRHAPAEAEESAAIIQEEESVTRPRPRADRSAWILTFRNVRAVHILQPSVATYACYREGKVGTNKLHRMPDRVLDNYLRAQRKHSGLTQKEIGRLLGYRKPWQVGRHERSQTTPPLLIALAYEVIFQVPVAALFTGMHATVVHVTEENVAALEKDLLTRKSAGHLPMVRTQTLKWLRHRKTSK